MIKDIRSRLEDARARGIIVRAAREGLEDGWIDGYVAALGDEFFALEVFDKAFRLNGYCCLRYRDVTDLRTPAPHAEFHEKALRARGGARSKSFDVDVSSLPLLLASAGRVFPLLTIHEEDENDACWIGKLVTVSDEEIELLYISPDAKFDEAPTIYRLEGICTVEFGGAYEEALHLVSRAN